MESTFTAIVVKQQVYMQYNPIHIYINDQPVPLIIT